MKEREAEIYALIDTALMRRYRIDIVTVAVFLKSNGIAIAQYRNKEGSENECHRDLELLREHYDGTIIVNDRIDRIDLADGLHLGQEDLSAIDKDPVKAVEKVRKRIGGKTLGLSTHNREEIEIANTLDLGYIGLGALRPTSTKEVESIGGEALLEIAKDSRHPVAIIGGVRWEDRFEEPIRYKVLGSALFERMLTL